MKLETAIETVLITAGAKNAKAVRSLLNASNLKLAADGSVEGLKEQLETVQKSDPYMFNEVQQTVFKGLEPGASADNTPGTKVDFSKMTYSEMAAYAAAHPGVKIE